MSKKTLRAGTSPFAHLLSSITGRRGRAEDEELKPDDEGDEGTVDPDEVIDDAEEPIDDAGDGDEPEEKPDGKKGKRARGKANAEDEDPAEEKAEDADDDEDMARARREGFLAAQARGRRIFQSASAGVRPDMAAHLAFNDEMPSTQAIAMLDMAADGTAPPAQGSRLGRRMARVVIPNPGSGPSGKRPEEQSFGEMALAAGKKAGIF